MIIIKLILGIFALWLSSELLIWAAKNINRFFKLSYTFLGLTLFSIGTTLPEFSTHIVSSLRILRGEQLSDLAIGTNIGSNIFQITVILGLFAIFSTIYTKREFLKKDYLVMLGAILLLFLLSLDGSISRLEGVILALLYIFYIYTLSKKEHLGEVIEKEVENDINHHIFRFVKIIGNMILMIGGFVLLFWAANFTLNAAIATVKSLGLTQTFVGTVIIGFGTALPEFAAAWVAFFRKAKMIGLGLLIGSNITNPLLGLGIGAAISTYSVSKSIIFFELPFWFLVSLIIYLFFILGETGRFRPIHGVFSILFYFLCLGFKINFGF